MPGAEVCTGGGSCCWSRVGVGVGATLSPGLAWKEGTGMCDFRKMAMSTEQKETKGLSAPPMFWGDVGALCVFRKCEVPVFPDSRGSDQEPGVGAQTSGGDNQPSLPLCSLGLFPGQRTVPGRHPHSWA